MAFVALILLLGSVFLSRWTLLRPLGPERRIQVMAVLCLLGLGILRVTVLVLNGAILTGTSRPFHIDLIVLVGGLSGALALGLAWSAVLDDSKDRKALLGASILFLLPLLIFLCGVKWALILALPVAIRTGWARQVAEQRRPSATLASIIGFVAVLAWPKIEQTSGPCWEPGGAPSAALLSFGQVFLALQLGLLSLRFLLGFIFGPRRIGRRLLVSHMLAGLVPVALTGLFAALIALLTLANFRASTATHLLKAQHRFSEEMLEQCVTEALAGMQLREPDPDSRWSSDELHELAARVAARWPQIASWRPAGIAPNEPEPGDIEKADEPGLLICAFVEADSAWGRCAVLTAAVGGAAGPVSVSPYEPPQQTGSEMGAPGSLPHAEAWIDRPESPTGWGLIKCGETSLHVSDCRFTLGDTSIRVDVIEKLPRGRVKILEERLDSRAWVEESFSFTTAGRVIRSGSGGATNPFKSSHVRLRAQEWIPAGPEPERTSQDDPSRSHQLEKGRWAQIMVPVLGVSDLAELIPPFSIRENPEALVPISILAFVMLLFVGVETLAFLSALRMGRAIAQSVGQLRLGTERLRQGELSYRINMTGRDELAALGEAFNEMATGLEEGQRTALEKERLEGELEIARRIQQRLLPARPPSIAGLQLSGLSVPARQVGGDYYDFLPIEEGKVLIVMADVSGKGAPAALLMSSLRASLHSMLPFYDNLAELAERLNRFVHASTDVTEFITLFIGVVDARSGQLSFVNAGHEQPYLIRKDGSLDRLRAGGLVIGAFPETSYNEETVQLRAGDLLFLFTDGLTEAHDPADQMFGEERCAECLLEFADQDPDDILRATLERVDTFVKGAEPSDDITLLAIRKVMPV